MKRPGIILAHTYQVPHQGHLVLKYKQWIQL
jgi:hypothetical protein